MNKLTLIRCLFSVRNHKDVLVPVASDRHFTLYRSNSFLSGARNCPRERATNRGHQSGRLRICYLVLIWVARRIVGWGSRGENLLC